MREIRANFAQNFHPHSGEAADVISSTRANYYDDPSWNDSKT